MTSANIKENLSELEEHDVCGHVSIDLNSNQVEIEGSVIKPTIHFTKTS